MTLSTGRRRRPPARHRGTRRLALSLAALLGGLLAARPVAAWEGEKDARRPDRALRLGDSSYAVLGAAGPAFDLTPGGARTYALWLRYRHREYHAKIFAKVGPPADRERGGSPPESGFSLFVHQYTGTLGIYTAYRASLADGDGYRSRGTAGLRPIGDGRWHHVALVQQDTVLTAYVDGKLDFRFHLRRGRDYTASRHPLMLGWSGAEVIHFVGEVDEVSVWERALSARQVRALMYGPPGPRAAGLLAHWPFDDDPAGRVRDVGPRAYHGWRHRAEHVPATRPLAPPFRETWAYRALLALAGLAALYALMRLYALRLERHKRRLERLVGERTRELARANDETARALRTVAAQAGRLQELGEAKSRFFANVSHEFRTPLTLILGPLEGLLAGRYGPLGPAVQGQHELMRRNARRLLRLVNQILDLAKLEASDLRLDPRPGDLVAFVREATLAFAPLAERRAVRLAFGSAVEALVVSFDGEQLEKVVLNLLSNALKFTEPDGTVTVTVRARDGHAELEVRDTGSGIPAEALPHVFDRFYQVDAASTRRHEGTGIGLALVRELVALHGGVVRVDSTRGAGSTFTVILPLAPAHSLPSARVPASAAGVPSTASGRADAAAPPADAPIDAEPWREVLSVAALVSRAPDRHDAAAHDAPGRPPEHALKHAPDDAAEHAREHALEHVADDAADRTTVLVVDDNPDVRLYVRSVLEPTYRVLEAADGAAGLEAARLALPDLVVADVMMPALDGLALAAALRDDPAAAVIPVVLLTARATDADQVAGLRAGADAYLAKPFAPEVLEAHVAGLLDQRRRLRARFLALGGARTPLLADGTPPASATRIAAPAAPEVGTGDPVPGEAAGPLHASALADQLRGAFAPHLGDPDFNPEALATAAGLSYPQLYRRLREVHDVSPSRFLRTVRVERAAGLLRDGAGSITEVAYAVGFNSLSYFNRAFRERYEVAPSDWAVVARQ